MFEHVDPFIGTAATDLPAAARAWPPDLVVAEAAGRQHPPGRDLPVRHGVGLRLLRRLPDRLRPLRAEHRGRPAADVRRSRSPPASPTSSSPAPARSASTTTTSASPRCWSRWTTSGTSWELVDEVAEPGYYAATLASGIRCEITVGPRSAVHRYTFPAHRDARLVIDFSLGGLAIPHGGRSRCGRTCDSSSPGVAQGEIVVEGAPLAVHLECDSRATGGRCSGTTAGSMPGGTRLDFDRIRPTTLRPFGLMWRGPSRGRSGGRAAVRLLAARRRPGRRRTCTRRLRHRRRSRFDARRADTADGWRRHLGRIAVETPSSERRTVFSTALYHSLIKPCFAPDESPFWPTDGPFAFDICTMWDIYRTQLPLLTALFPDRAVELANALLNVCEEEGNFPIGYRMARGADRFFRQGSALAHTFLADLCQLGAPGIDWDWASCTCTTTCAARTARTSCCAAWPTRSPTPSTWRSATTAPPGRPARRRRPARRPVRGAGRPVGQRLRPRRPGCCWTRRTTRAASGTTRSGCCTTWRPGSSWPAATTRSSRCSTSSSATAPTRSKQLGERPGVEEMAAGYALNRFEGLNNEPDMEAPWAYHYAGRPDRTAEVVHAAVQNQFGIGRGGLPGNDDSGGLSSWYVWASLGPVPGRRAEPVPDQRPGVRPRPGSRSAAASSPSRPPGFVEPEPERSAAVRPVGHAQRRAARAPG